ncbi:hypothetical protein SDC9_100360 [bioreactor metagenome]|uniref:DUF370 domain-containing protein n=1 Tax=bioreactor metagenome TaxID=1076179 RepID=A0A645AK49_9ZZZZ
MFIHLGGSVIVNANHVIGIFDLDTCSISKNTKLYLAQAQKNNRVVNVSAEIPKSFIVCNENGKIVVYISQISSATLNKRQDFLHSVSIV